MTLTTKKLAGYLGCSASIMLFDDPFSTWSFKKSVDSNCDPPRIDYVSNENGISFECDEDARVCTIFLHFDDPGRFNGTLADIPADSTRQQVLSLLGPPEKSGPGLIDPILGEYGPWDRFARDGYSIHVEYRVRSNSIRLITLMRADVVP